jgi:hypothetical protein
MYCSVVWKVRVSGTDVVADGGLAVVEEPAEPSWEGVNERGGAVKVQA